MSKGMAFCSLDISITLCAATKRNSASLSMKFFISQGQAIQSTFACSLVIHFILLLLLLLILFTLYFLNYKYSNDKGGMTLFNLSRMGNRMKVIMRLLRLSPKFI